MSEKTIDGFSKLSKYQKIEWLNHNFSKNKDLTLEVFSEFWMKDDSLQQTIDGFSENTISNFILPFGLAPNFLIDDDIYCVPMVIEESSVVAAASSAAKFWLSRGGFKTTILGTTKVGHIHFTWVGPKDLLFEIFPQIKVILLQNSLSLTENMRLRGGGISDIELLDFSSDIDNLYQLRVHFQTCDSMGANFINTVLENFAHTLENFFMDSAMIPEDKRDIDVIMSILSNYTPECVVRAEVSCPVSMIDEPEKTSRSYDLANKFCKAVQIAHVDPYRATTHNKGIFNGIDSVVIATGNDFRAIEAAGHCYASKDGKYRSLSYCSVENDIFRFWIDIPLAVGTIGGLTSLHPLAKRSLEILGNPSAEKLMRIIASVGLAQNFAALRSLVTTGIQKGHMKMHLQNILNHLHATVEESKQVYNYFENQTITFSGVRDYLLSIR